MIKLEFCHRLHWEIGYAETVALCNSWSDSELICVWVVILLRDPIQGRDPYRGCKYHKSMLFRSENLCTPTQLSVCEFDIRMRSEWCAQITATLKCAQRVAMQIECIISPIEYWQLEMQLYVGEFAGNFKCGIENLVSQIEFISMVGGVFVQVEIILLFPTLIAVHKDRSHIRLHSVSLYSYA